MEDMQLVMPTAAPDLSDLGEGWHHWPHWNGIVRWLDEDRWVAIVPFIYTDAILVGPRGVTMYYEDRWCYHTAQAAVLAAEAWCRGGGVGEPLGWHRHPGTDRRR